MKNVSIVSNVLSIKFFFFVALDAIVAIQYDDSEHWVEIALKISNTRCKSQQTTRKMWTNLSINFVFKCNQMKTDTVWPYVSSNRYILVHGLPKYTLIWIPIHKIQISFEQNVILYIEILPTIYWTFSKINDNASFFPHSIPNDRSWILSGCHHNFDSHQNSMLNIPSSYVDNKKKGKKRKKQTKPIYKNVRMS